jgi:hypothetical protein
MSRPEASLWDHLRGLLPTEIHYSRIESETSPGFPDVHFTLDGVTGGIELKSTKRPKAKYPFSGKDGLRKTQIRWIRDELDACGWVLLCLECDPYIFLLQAEMYYDELYRMTQSDIGRVAAVVWTRKGPKPLDELAVALVNKS